ncbi:MAG: hypothetical protein COT73_08200 [Bdellovibrio sp. CG10_big_fil_rev_8_21_14_0_10_47_8]|nr:MAG: hypothetical protein COT73_08200 [Bdellovibrio sp. CG10_big_fil_rev_8_21_14_0_10_47_8]
MGVGCPLCSYILEQDFGIMTCPSCQTVFSVDIDGQIELNQEPAGDSVTSGSADPIPTADEFLNPQGSNEYQDQWMSTETPSTEPAEVLLENNESTVEDMEVLPEPEEVYLPSEPETLQSARDSLATSSDGSPLSYTVTIESIDGKELRAQLLDALSDSRFQWDVRELNERIKKGRLVLENLNPVKASLTISRLRDLPVKIHWRQSAY